MSMAAFIASAVMGVAAASAGDALPYTVPVYEVSVEADVIYSVTDGYWTEGPDNGVPPAGYWMKPLGFRQPLEMKMDIYTPEGDASKSRPLLLMMHGGAYLIGSKNEKGQTEWCKYFASLGYVAASIDYRLGFPLSRQGVAKAEEDALDDARAALEFLLGREDLRIDPQRVFAAGTSAGGALALGLAYGSIGAASPAAPRADSPSASPTYHIRAIANLWGYVHDLSVLEQASVPIVSFQSEQDPIVPYTEGYPLKLKMAGKAFGTKAVHDRASSLGIHCDHTPISRKGHRLHLDENGELTPEYYAIRDRLTAFFAYRMAGK